MFTGIGKEKVSDCIDCPGGFFCAATGGKNVSGPCSPGYYCEKSSSSATPNGLGGNSCPKGKFCPEVSMGHFGAIAYAPMTQ